MRKSGAAKAEWRPLLLELEQLLSVTGRMRLEFDLACEGVYDRTLAYLFTVPESDDDTEIFLNEWLLEEGFAKVYDEDVGQARDIRYFERFQEAQAKAQSLEKGLWGACF